MDLKSDRKAGALRVQAAWREPDADGETAAVLADELTLMAGWLGLERVEVAGRGDLASALDGALQALPHRSPRSTTYRRQT